MVMFVEHSLAFKPDISDCQVERYLQRTTNVRFLYHEGCAVDPKCEDTVSVMAVMSWSLKFQFFERSFVEKLVYASVLKILITH